MSELTVVNTRPSRTTSPSATAGRSSPPSPPQMAAIAPSSWVVDQEEVAAGKHFKNQLVAVVRRMDWTYAIFWSSSNNRSGVLTWKEGFYNGEVKTTKVVGSGIMKTAADEEPSHGQRSVQLRQLYASLVSGAVCGEQRAKRPADPSLSLDDLADNEWYYVVSMSYAFLPGEGCPGKCFASNEYVWLCDAQSEDAGRIFMRMPLAKSSSLRTVVCIPFMDGALELGTTELLLDDPELVTRTMTLFWELQHSTPYDQGKYFDDGLFESIIHDDSITKTQIHEKHDQYDYDHGTMFPAATPSASLQATTLIDQATIGTDMDKPIKLDNFRQEDGSTWMTQGYLQSLTHGCQTSTSSFMTWGKSRSDAYDIVAPMVLIAKHSQQMLKKVVVSEWVDGGGMSEPEGNINNHAMSERRRREKLKDMFLTLKSLVPSAHKLDKASILAETIDHLRELKQRVQELESSRFNMEPTTEATRHPRRSDINNRKALQVAIEEGVYRT